MSLFFKGCLSAASVAALATGVAQAQEQERLDTVIVTTIGPDRSADELIGTTTALDREEIVERLATSLGDTLISEPGVSTTFFGQGASRPVLRGLGAERVQVLTNGIGVIDASAASPDHQVSADGIDAERIEILRGPSALAYGGQAIGGVVNVIDGLIAEDLPEKPITAEGFAAYNSVNEGAELAGRFQGAAGPFVLTLSASARDLDNYDIPDFAESAFQMAAEEAEEEDHEEEEGHEEEEEQRGTLENSFAETQTLAAGLSWVGDNAFFGVAIRQQTAEYGLPGHGHEHGEEEGEEHDEGEEHEEEEEENPFIDLEHTRIDLRGGIDLDGDFLTGINGTLAIVDYEHTEFEAPGEAGTLYANEGVEGRVELNHQIAGFQGAVGVQFIDTDFSAVGEEAFVTPTESQSLGIFIFETREFESGVGVDGGLRFESVERDNISGVSVDYDNIAASAGLHRHFEGGAFLGAQLSYTERAPSDVELFADGPHLATEQFEVGDVDLEQEKGLNLEGTARWTGDALSLGVNVFATSFDGFIFLAPGQTLEDGVLVSEADDLPVFLYEQRDASFFGAEFYGDLAIEDGPLGADWDFGASLDFVEADLDGGGNVPFVPPTTFYGSAAAEWGAFEVGAAVTHATDQNDPGEGQFATEGYTTLDLRAELDVSDFGVGSDGTELFVEARNVTDEEVRYATSVLKDVAPAPGQNIRVGIRAVF
ncbi:MAG: TonB-dependent receptor [Pseudomonadota bacterium]